MNIWTNGCYDILHIGHIKLFEYASKLGNSLHVGIDSDQRIKITKGNNRPINTQDNRKFMLESIRYIDTVDIFDSNTELENLIHKYKIDTIVIGDDYKDKPVVGASLVKSIIFFPKIPNISTSLLYESIISTTTD